MFRQLMFVVKIILAPQNIPNRLKIKITKNSPLEDIFISG